MNALRILPTVSAKQFSHVYFTDRTIHVVIPTSGYGKKELAKDSLIKYCRIIMGLKKDLHIAYLIVFI